MLAALTLLAAVFAAPAPRADSYQMRWAPPGSAGAYPIGVGATFGTGPIYNYTAVPEGTAIVLFVPHVPRVQADRSGNDAPKFFYKTFAGNIGSPGELRVNGIAGDLHCVDAGGAWDGEVVRIQPCSGARSQQWIVKGTDRQVRLARTSGLGRAMQS